MQLFWETSSQTWERNPGLCTLFSCQEIGIPMRGSLDFPLPKLIHILVPMEIAAFGGQTKANGSDPLAFCPLPSHFLVDFYGLPRAWQRVLRTPSFTSFFSGWRILGVGCSRKGRKKQTKKQNKLVPVKICSLARWKTKESVLISCSFCSPQGPGPKSSVGERLQPRLQALWDGFPGLLTFLPRAP